MTSFHPLSGLTGVAFDSRLLAVVNGYPVRIKEHGFNTDGRPEWVPDLNTSRNDTVRDGGEVLHLWLCAGVPRRYFLAARGKWGWLKHDGWNSLADIVLTIKRALANVPSADAWDGRPGETYHDYLQRYYEERRTGAAI